MIVYWQKEWSTFRHDLCRQRIFMKSLRSLVLNGDKKILSASYARKTRCMEESALPAV